MNPILVFAQSSIERLLTSRSEIIPMSDQGCEPCETNPRYSKFIIIVFFLFMFCSVCSLSGCISTIANKSESVSLVASPSSVNLGSVSVGAVATAAVSLVNKSSVPVNVTQVGVAGQSFSVTEQNGFPASIPAGGSYSLTVTFNPATVGPATGQLTITSDDSASNGTVISLIGAGASGAVTNVALNSLFCNHSSVIGSSSVPCTVTLTAAAPSGGAVVSLASSKTSVQVPATVTVPENATSALFNASVASVSTTQSIELTASEGSKSVNFAMQLIAYVPTLQIGTSSLAFGTVDLNTPTTKTVSLASVGTAPVIINAASLNGSGFALTGAAFPLTLNPAQTQILTVQFDPNVAGAAVGSLTFSSNSSTNGSAAVSLSGTGIVSPTFANISIGTTRGNAIPSTFMGWSHEWGTAQTMMGDSTIGVDQIYRRLLQNLTVYGSGPINIRIGGDSTDATGEPTSTTAQPFAELANDLDVRFSLGVNLGSDNVDLAVDQATAFVNQMPAGSLDAIEIGNEPDMYVSKEIRPSPYTYEDYSADFNTWKTNIAPLLPLGTKFMGPSWASPGSLSNAPSFDAAEATALTNLTQHYYVADGEASNPDDIMLFPSSATAGSATVAPAVVIAHHYGVPFRMGEMNSLFDGGEAGISNAFETALWAVDAMFNYGNVGVDGVNWHFGTYAIYAPFTIKVKTSGTSTAYSLTSVTPLYYGLLFFQAATGNSAHLLPVTVDTQANLTGWATVDASGTPRLAIINKDENLTGTVSVILPGYSQAQVYRLTAPSYLSTSGVAFAGQTFDGSTDGTIQGTQTVETIDVTSGVFQIPMPITSAALVVFSN